MKDLDRKGNNQSGSLKNSEPEFLVAGKLRKSHGLERGDVDRSINGSSGVVKSKVFLFLLAKGFNKEHHQLFSDGW